MKSRKLKPGIATIIVHSTCTLQIAKRGHGQVMKGRRDTCSDLSGYRPVRKNPDTAMLSSDRISSETVSALHTHNNGVASVNKRQAPSAH
jgi:hypothetical protein